MKWYIIVEENGIEKILEEEFDSYTKAKEYADNYADKHELVTFSVFSESIRQHIDNVLRRHTIH